MKSKNLIASFIIFFWGFNFFIFSNNECNAKKETKFQGAFFDGKLLGSEQQKRVESTICQIITDIDNCSYLKPAEKSAIKKNMNKNHFNVVFTELSGCGEGNAVPFYGLRISITKAFLNSDFFGLCCPFKSVLAHELLHVWYPLNGTSIQECKTYKLEQKCFCPDMDFEVPNGKYKCDKNKIFQNWLKEHDNADDNNSLSNNSDFFDESISSKVEFDQFCGNFSYYSYFPDFLIYNRFKLDQKEFLLKELIGCNYFSLSKPELFSNNYKVLFISTGELEEDYNSEIFKNAIKAFVDNGGSVIIFCQQYGEHIDNLGLTLDGETQRNIGWRESQCCTINSAFFDQVHPITSGQTTHAISIAVDGYTDTWPSSATVVLRHRLSGRPILLYYPFGEGMVFLASGMYSDWASAHSQMTTAERKIVRDLISFAQAPKLPIQMIDYNIGSNPVINLEAKLVNPGEIPAVKAIIKVTTPDKDRILFETTEDISVNASGEAIIPISFTLPEISTNEWGIFHTLYQLLDADGQPLKWETESLTARRMSEDVRKIG